MSTYRLKILAITAMLIDHIGAIFIPADQYFWLNFTFRAIGRLAFPIFVFLIVEGFYHTRDIKKYLTRLGSFALISELPFDFAFYRYHSGGSVISDILGVLNHTVSENTLLRNLTANQNVFFTLFLGLLLITLMDMVEKKFQKEIITSNLIDGALTIVFCAVAYFLHTDYDVAGILMIVAFYLFRSNKIIIAISVFIIMSTILSNVTLFKQTGNPFAIISILATFAMIPIAFYNGEKGKNIKYFFYIFYPAHLFILFLITLL